MVALNQVYFAYRPRWSDNAARLIVQKLTAQGLDVYWNEHAVDEGFPETDRDALIARPYFILLFTASCLLMDTHRTLPNDTRLCREIEQALFHRRVIVPVFTPEFQFSQLAHMPMRLAEELRRINAVELPYRYLDYALAEVKDLFLKPIELRARPETGNEVIARSALERAIERRMARHFDLALSDVNEALREQPTLADAFVLRATILYDMGRYADSEKAIEYALSVCPPETHVAIHRGHAEFLEEADNYKAALEAWHKAIEIAPNDGDLYVSLAYAVYMSSRRLSEDEMQEVIQNVTHALTLPLSVDDRRRALKVRGHAYNAIGQNVKSVQDYTDALHADPDDSEVYFYRAEAYWEMQYKREAEDDFRRYLELAPDGEYAAEAGEKLK